MTIKKKNWLLEQIESGARDFDSWPPYMRRNAQSCSSSYNEKLQTVKLKISSVIDSKPFRKRCCLCGESKLEWFMQIDGTASSIILCDPCYDILKQKLS